MFTVLINGGLGNQLFQVFATLAAAIRTGDTCYFLRVPTDAVGKRPTYWNTLLRSLTPMTVIPTPENVQRFMRLPEHREPHSRTLRFCCPKQSWSATFKATSISTTCKTRSTTSSVSYTHLTLPTKRIV